MGEWRADQSKGVRRYVWGQTRGEQDPTRRDFMRRLKDYPELSALRIEKIGSEIHAWREVLEDGGRRYWVSCLRFVPDEWGYWDVFYRTDERRWRPAGIDELPVGKALGAAAEFFREKFVL